MTVALEKMKQTVYHNIFIIALGNFLKIRCKYTNNIRNGKNIGDGMCHYGYPIVLVRLSHWFGLCISFFLQQLKNLLFEVALYNDFAVFGTTTYTTFAL